MIDFRKYLDRVFPRPSADEARELYYEIMRHNMLCAAADTLSAEGLTRAEHWVEMSAFQALLQIRHIMRDDTLRDVECFAQIEEVIRILEEHNVDFGSRHDF